MNTMQSNVGRGNYANLPPQMAPNAAKTPIEPDDRVSPFFAAQSQLLALVDDYATAGFASGPIEAINELLYNWLTTPSTDLQQMQTANQLHTVLELIEFLTKLYEANVTLNSNGKEVSNENA